MRQSSPHDWSPAGDSPHALKPEAQLTEASPRPAPAANAYLYLGTLIAAYIGVYLCRKNFSVAIPILQSEWGASKEQLGLVGSVSTLAYVAGKLVFGPFTDRFGGRRSLLVSMSLVALFGGLGAMAPSLGPLLVFYSLNRFTGAASWGAMVKLVPEWFGPRKLAFACGLLSLSFVFGGALAVSLGGLVAYATRDSAAAVLGVPSVVLLLLVGWGAITLPRQKPHPAGNQPRASSERLGWREYVSLFTERQFAIVLALSFTLTMLRETFNLWTVDFIATEGGAGITNSVAAYVSTPFDLCGAVGIVLMGWQFDRLGRLGRRNLLALILLLLAGLLAILPLFFGRGLLVLALSVGLVGFLVYGPYSLLAGVLSVEVRGKEYAATVSGVVDGVGYLAGVVSGVVFGKLLSVGGYQLGFEVMAAVTLVSAALVCLLYPANARQSPESTAKPELAATP